MKRILIVGCAGRGKTTLAARLSEQFGIKKYSTDDFYWKVKFTKKADKEKSIDRINKIYLKDEWIVEGSTRHLIKNGFTRAQLIILMVHRSLVLQYWILFKRFLRRDYERFIDLLDLWFYLFVKKHKLGGHKSAETLEEMLYKYRKKVITLSSFKEINDYLGKL